MSRLKPSDRTERRIQMFIDRSLFKHKTDVLDAAVELLVRKQMQEDSLKQNESYRTDIVAQQLQTEAIASSGSLDLEVQRPLRVGNAR